MNIDWKKSAELVALLSVVASLLFVGYEIRLSREVALTESYYSSEENQTNLRSLLIGENLIWRKGCLDETLTEDERVIFSNLVKAVNTHYFMTWRRSVEGITISDEDRWPMTVALNMLHYPGFGKAWRASESVAPSTMFFDTSNDWVLQVESHFESFSNDPEMQAPEQFLCGI